MPFNAGESFWFFSFVGLSVIFFRITGSYLEFPQQNSALLITLVDKVNKEEPLQFRNTSNRGRTVAESLSNGNNIKKSTIVQGSR